MAAIQIGIIQFFDPNTGKPIANGTVAAYEAGGNTPKATYSDSSESVMNANPVALDASGCASFYGSGSYRFVCRNSCGEIVRELDNIGLVQSGSSVPDQDTVVIDIGDTDNQFDGSDLVPIYGPDNSVKGMASITKTVMAGAEGAGSVLGEYATVSETFAEGGAEMPAGSRVFAPPQDGYDGLSTRLYELSELGSANVNPESDTNVDQKGSGDNYVDLFRMAATEEMRVKKVVGQWDGLNEVISFGTLDYPIMCFGSDGVLYKTTGSPSAADILGTDPVSDADHAVWVYVYDPTATAAYPPAYRGQSCADFNSTVSVKFPIQYAKLKNTSGEYTNDGAPTEIFYKNISATWAYGAGTSGSPAAGGGLGAIGGTDWVDCYMIKTESGVVDYMNITNGSDPVAALNNINALAAEIAAGRSWKYYRRVATVRAVAGALLEWYRKGDEYYLATTQESGNLTASGDVTVTAPPGHLARLSLYVSAIAHLDVRTLVKCTLLGYSGSTKQSTSGGYDMTVYEGLEHDVNYKSAGGGEYVRATNTTSQVYLEIEDNDSNICTFKIKSQGWIDHLSD